MSAMILFITVPLFFLLHLIYLQIGSNLKIYARKQDQSRRGQSVTGAGILFALAWEVFFFLNEFVWPVFMMVLLMATIIGFIDDVWEVPIFIQILGHGILFFLLLNDLGISNAYPLYVLVLSILFSLGFLLVISKHDGSNGLLLSTSMVFFLTLPFLFPNAKTLEQNNPVIYIIFVLLSFGWFNFREKAQLFMGAAGRIAITYLIIFFLLHVLFGADINMMSSGSAEIKTLGEFKPQLLLLFSVPLLDVIQAFIKNLISGKYFQQLPLIYSYLKQKNYPFYAIALIYVILQGIVNMAVIKLL